ncbi:MAG: hypothetical protein OQL19_20165 [Gammaproteobacteria bacterium]|nr:hypothetical protein [Gammaproteobacteria bacterium]
MDKLIFFVLSCFIWQVSIASADDLELGIRFFEQQDYAKAKKLWQPLAHQGDARAQYNMALLLNKELLNKDSLNSKNDDKTQNILQREEVNQYLAMSRSKGLVDGYYVGIPTMDTSFIPPSNAQPVSVEVENNSINEPLDWLNQQQKSTYTLQLATGKSWKSMEVMQKKLISSQSLLQPQNVFIHEIDKKVQEKFVTRYVLVYGVFETYQEAKSEVEKLPESIQKASPWIRQFGVIQSIVNTKQKNKKT